MPMFPKQPSFNYSHLLLDVLDGIYERYDKKFTPKEFKGKKKRYIKMEFLKKS